MSVVFRLLLSATTVTASSTIPIPCVPLTRSHSHTHTLSPSRACVRSSDTEGQDTPYLPDPGPRWYAGQARPVRVCSAVIVKLWGNECSVVFALRVGLSWMQRQPSKLNDMS